MTDKEQLESSIFTFAQLEGLNNLLSEYANLKINLEDDQDHKEKFLQEDAGHKSKIELLQYLIAQS